MRVLIAPDRYSGNLTAAHAARALATGWQRQAPGDVLTTVPLSDGSAGLLDVVHAACGGALTSVTVQGPLGGTVPAAVLRLPGPRGGTAYVEASQVLGSHLVAAEDRARAATTGTSAGLGELLGAALATGASRVVVGLPARAAVHDAGAGALAALGDAPAGHPLRAGGLALGELRPEDLGAVEGVTARLAGHDIVLAVPDDLPLLGLHGAGAVLGELPEVGPHRAQELERALGHATTLLDRTLQPVRPALHVAGPDAERGPTRGARRPFSGAGGGTAYLLQALGARPMPGAEVVAHAVGLDRHLDGAELVVTGCGVLDAPALHASVVATVGRRAMGLGLPVVVVADEIHTNRREVAQIGVSGSYEVLTRRRDGTTAPGAPERAVEAVADRAARVARTWSVPD